MAVRVTIGSWIKTTALVATLAICPREPAAAQLPFDITPEDVSAIDTTLVQWTGLRTWVGGVEGELRYGASEVAEGECKALALLGLVKLRNYYQRQREESPVTLRLTLRCGTAYRGSLAYDGVVVRLDLYDRTTGARVYQGRHRGLP